MHVKFMLMEKILVSVTLLRSFNRQRCLEIIDNFLHKQNHLYNQQWYD